VTETDDDMDIWHVSSRCELLYTCYLLTYLQGHSIYHASIASRGKKAIVAMSHHQNSKYQAVTLSSTWLCGQCADKKYHLLDICLVFQRSVDLVAGWKRSGVIVGVRRPPLDADRVRGSGVLRRACLSVCLSVRKHICGSPSSPAFTGVMSVEASYCDGYVCLCVSCRAAVGTEFLSPYPPHTHTHGDPHTHGRPG